MKIKDDQFELKELSNDELKYLSKQLVNWLCLHKEVKQYQGSEFESCICHSELEIK